MFEYLYLKLFEFYKNKNKKKSQIYLKKFIQQKIKFLINTSKTNKKNTLKIISLKNFFLKEKLLNQGLIFYNKIFYPKFYTSMILKKFNYNDRISKNCYKYYDYIYSNENLQNKVLFIFDYKCGSGDFIMFSRYIPILKNQAKKLIIEVPENLFSLYQYNFPNCEIILAQDKEYKGKYDYTYHHELFLNIQKDLETFPNSEGYLNPDPKLIQQMQDTGIFDTEKKKVGIFWQSSSGINYYRSISTEQIIPILGNKNIQFYSLTKEEVDTKTKEILEKYNVITCAPYINNAHDTAAIMKNLDLVISTDSFPIHLAGALGVKAFLMLPFDSDWRWFNETEKTAWYDSVRIFKQTIPNKWNDVIQRVSLALEQFAKEKQEAVI